MKKGFTLLELLIVVVILGVLALIAAPTLLNAADQAKAGTVKANVSAAASSITSQMALDENNLSASSIAGTVAGQLNTNNTNPINKGIAAFVVGAAVNSVATGGTVYLTCDDTNRTVSINGVDKKGVAVLAKAKLVSAPQN